MNHATPAARTIAAGGNPRWTGTFTHRVFGELTFSAKLPLSVDSLRHSIAMDNLLRELGGGGSVQTRILAAAIAGLSPQRDEDGDLLGPASKGLLVELPIVKSQTEPIADGAGERTVHTYYDAAAELDIDFLSDVWIAYSRWRSEQLTDETVAAVGESSGAPITS